MKKKCEHTKCIRDASSHGADNGFCDKCIQLNTKECNMCLTKEKAILNEGNTKHKCDCADVVESRKFFNVFDKFFWFGFISGLIIGGLIGMIIMVI